MEAMALGLPVVSTNVGGMPYLIDDGVDGVLVAPDSAEAMTTAILRCFAQPDNTKQLAEQARRKVEGYDWEVVKPQWETVLRLAAINNEQLTMNNE